VYNYINFLHGVNINCFLTVSTLLPDYKVQNIAKMLPWKNSINKLSNYDSL
jgi:hypothetical protein